MQGLWTSRQFQAAGMGNLGLSLTSSSLWWLSSVAQCMDNGSRSMAVAKVALGVPCALLGSMCAWDCFCSTLSHSAGHMGLPHPGYLGQGGAHLQVDSSSSCLRLRSTRRLR